MDAKEGDIRTTVEKLVRRGCDNCGEPATCRILYILPNTRSNPASSGYGRDDEAWRSDDEAWACDECKRTVENDTPSGMEWCSTFPGDTFPHPMLYWEQVSSEIVAKEK